MGYNGEILVGRGGAFITALNESWNWEEEVVDDWMLRDGWRAISVRTPALDDELDELAETADYPILACWVFESDTCHIRGISAAGRWDAWLNPGYAARLHAWNIVNDELGGDLHEGGSLADHARANRLEAEIAARLETERPDAACAVAAWAAQSGQYSDVTRIEAILATPWKPQAQWGFFTLLAQLGIADEEPGSER